MGNREAREVGWNGVGWSGVGALSSQTPPASRASGQSLSPPARSPPSPPHALPTHLGQRSQQQHSLAPGCVDLVPPHRLLSCAAQAQAADGAAGAVEPDAEGVVMHCSALKRSQRRRTGLQPACERW